MTAPVRGVLLLVLSSVACRLSLSPLQNRIAVGRESFVVFVGEGEGGLGDLFAVRTTGGPVYPVTYTRVHESRPALAPSGRMLAFLRAGTAADSLHARLVVMNLLNGAERVLLEADSGVTLRTIAWHPDETRLYVRTSDGILEAEAPPAGPSVGLAGDPAGADSALRVLLGDPPFAEVTACGGGEGTCTRSREGSEFLLPAGLTDPFRWGGDSLAYFLGEDLVVRPLGGGRARTIQWSDVPAHPRQATVSLVPIGP